MQLISPADALFLIAESRDHPMRVGALALFEPPEGLGSAEFARQVYQRLVSADEVHHPVFRKRPSRLLGTPQLLWARERCATGCQLPAVDSCARPGPEHHRHRHRRQPRLRRRGVSPHGARPAPPHRPPRHRPARSGRHHPVNDPTPWLADHSPGLDTAFTRCPHAQHALASQP